MTRIGGFMADEANSEPAKIKSGKKKWWVITLVSILIIMLASGGYFGYSWQKKAKAESKNKATFYPRYDVYYGKSMKVTAKTGGDLSVINEDKVTITLSIPANALVKDTVISMVPLKSPKGVKSAPGVYITPTDTVLVRPATLNFDYSSSKSAKNDSAPDSIGKKPRVSGEMHIYRVNPVSFKLMPQLVARAGETKDNLSGEVLGLGTYIYSDNSDTALESSTYALSAKKKNLLSVIESATTLLSQKKKLDSTQIKLADKAVRRIASTKNPNPIELYAAIQLNSLMHDKKLVMIDNAKAEVLPGLFKYECKITSHDPAQLLSLYRAAQSLGEDAGAESCKENIRGIITQDLDKLVKQDDPKYNDILKAERNIIQFEIGDEWFEKVKNKGRDKAVREANAILADDKASKEILILVMQNVDKFAPDETELRAEIDARMRDKMGQSVEDVINDPFATMSDIARAIGQNNFNNNDAEQSERQAQLQRKLENKVRDAAIDAMGDPNTTADKYNEIANAADALGIDDLAELMRKKAKDAPKSTPKQPEAWQEQSDTEIPYTDPGQYSQAAQELEEYGLETFDQPGFNAWGEDIKGKAYEASGVMLTECQAQGGGALCYFGYAILRMFGDEFEKAAKEFGAEVGEVQAQPDEEVKTPDSSGGDDSRISGNCLTKEDAAQLSKADANKYTLCDGVTENDFGTASQEADDEEYFDEDGTVNEDYDGDFTIEKCREQAASMNIDPAGCDFLQGLVDFAEEWQKATEQAEAEMQAEQNSGGSAPGLQNAANAMPDAAPDETTSTADSSFDGADSDGGTVDSDSSAEEVEPAIPTSDDGSSDDSE